MRLNTSKLEIPTSHDLWNTDMFFEHLLRKNVFGWVRVSVKEVEKKFIAKSIFDGQFSIRIEPSDFKLSQPAQESLVRILKRDLPCLTFVSNFSLNFIYFKFECQRL